MKNTKIALILSVLLSTLLVTALFSSSSSADELSVSSLNFPPSPQSPFPQVIRLYSQWTQFGFCSGANYYFCSQEIVRQANGMALNQDVNSCLARGGVAATYGDCQTNCFPFFLPYNAPFQSVSCSSTCTLDCQIQ